MAMLLLAVSLPAQTRLTIEQLFAFIQSSVKLQHPDKQVAAYLSQVKLSEKLDERTIEELQGLGAGPRTVQALRSLKEASASLPAPQPKAPRPAAVQIPPPSPEEQHKIIEETREYALNYTKSLPDFICTQVTRRFYDPSGLEFWQSADTLTTRVSYFEQKEDYKLIMINNRMTTQSYDSVGGATSTGEFGSLLREIFLPESNTRFLWERWATLRGHRAYVFAYRVSQLNSKWRISFERRLEIIAGYNGLIYIDKETGMVLRITLEAEDIPPSFPIQQAATVLDYDFAKISEREFLLPLRAQVRMRQGKFLTRNDVEFRLYRKFSAESTITYTPEPLPEDQTKEQPAQPPAAGSKPQAPVSDK
jgi:hypothetical protein